jgi:hypothetical protein
MCTAAAETWCLKAKNVAQSAQVSRKDNIRKNNIKKKMDVTRSLLDDIRTKELQWYGYVQRMEEGDCQKKL